MYDLITEEEYESVVRKRQRDDDFVVDDGASLAPLVRPPSLPLHESERVS